ncbi:MAG: response regulator transcription factor [Myxococcota bacterium]|nr:response regulator transcription factor [Myxococcota bacterium]
MTVPALRILLVDDDVAWRDDVRQLLADEMPEALVVEAGSAEEALARAQGDDWELVLLDIRLPGLSGLEALPRLRAAKPSALVIVLSGLPEQPYAAAAATAGASAYLLKERAPELLPHTVRRLLAGRTTSAEPWGATE